LLLLVTAWSLVLGGMIIMTVGMTSVFVPTDLEFMQVASADLAAANPHRVKEACSLSFSFLPSAT